MDHIENLKTAITLPWKNKYLWGFGLILAICGGGSSYQGPTSGRDDYQNELGGTFENIMNNPLLIGVIVFAIIIISLLITIVSAYLANSAKAGIMTSVLKLKLGQTTSFRPEWSNGKRFWLRMFGQDLILVFAILIIFVPLTLLLILNPAVVYLICCVILVLLLPCIFIGLLFTIAKHYIVYYERGAINSIVDAWNLVKRSFIDLLVAFLLMLLVWFVYFIFMMIIGMIIVFPMILLGAGIASMSMVAGIIYGIFASILMIIIMLPFASYLIAVNNTFLSMTFIELNPDLLQAPSGEEV